MTPDRWQTAIFVQQYPVIQCHKKPHAKARGLSARLTPQIRRVFNLSAIKRERSRCGAILA